MGRLVCHPRLPLVVGIDTERFAARMWAWDGGGLRELSAFFPSTPRNRLTWARRVLEVAWHPMEPTFVLAGPDGLLQWREDDGSSRCLGHRSRRSTGVLPSARTVRRFGRLPPRPEARRLGRSPTRSTGLADAGDGVARLGHRCRRASRRWAVEHSAQRSGRDVGAVRGQQLPGTTPRADPGCRRVQRTGVQRGRPVLRDPRQRIRAPRPDLRVPVAASRTGPAAGRG